MWVTSSHCSLPEQARLSALFATRIEKSHDVIIKLHTLILSSLTVFFSGLLVFFHQVKRPIFYTMLSWTMVFFFYHESDRFSVFYRSSSPSYTPPAQGKAEEQAPDIDGDILKRTLDMLRSDDDLEQFFEAIPGFCASKIIVDPQHILDILGRQRLAGALVAFWNRTLSSNWASESVKGQRLIICTRVIEAADLYFAVPHILCLFSGDHSGVSRSVEIGHSIRILRNGNTASLSRGIIAGIVSNAERNDRWFKLAMDELGTSRDILQGYLTHGDSVLLANLIHITRHFFNSLRQCDLNLTRVPLIILPSVSKFDILNTLPELQHDFCALWNEIVHQAQSSGADGNPFIDILIEIRHLYVVLHGADAALGYFFASTTGHDDLFRQPAAYPLCMMPDHHPNSATRTKETDSSTALVGGSSQVTTTSSPILPELSPGGVLDMSPHAVAVITQDIADTNPISSMTQLIAGSPSSTDDVRPPDEGITVSS